MTSQSETGASNPLVSIALATYNGEKYLDSLLVSIMKQDYPNMEVVICDDASSDSTWEILKKYSNNDNVKIIRNEQNLGFIKNFEKVLLCCRGDFIALADQDDLWEPNKLSCLTSVIQEKQALMVFSDAEVIDHNNHLLYKSLEVAHGINFTCKDYKSFYLYNCVTGCTTLIDRSLLNYSLPFPKGIIVHDWWLAFVAARLGGLTFVREKLIRYRIHSENQIGLNNRSWAESLIEIFLKISFPWRLLESSRKLQLWQEKYIDYFYACKTFEGKYYLESETTTKMIEWAEQLHRPLMIKIKLIFFIKNFEMFWIVPSRFRLPAFISRLISSYDYYILSLLTCCSYLVILLVFLLK